MELVFSSLIWMSQKYFWELRNGYSSLLFVISQQHYLDDNTVEEAMTFFQKANENCCNQQINNKKVGVQFWLGSRTYLSKILLAYNLSFDISSFLALGMTA